ncbi:hypothetical protein F3J11_38360, partial [Burkholderia sp. Cy-647]|uniref:hypothetical protein n=1 Tax=Burkholderia sp. Cy-647 TaxID=2608328 RepID=UPI0019649565
MKPFRFDSTARHEPVPLRTTDQPTLARLGGTQPAPRRTTMSAGPTLIQRLRAGALALALGTLA